MKTMKLTQEHIRRIRKVLNDDGWRGYRKELAERVGLDDENSTDAISINHKLFEDSDMHDVKPLDDWRGTEFELCEDGSASFDIWMYARDELVDWREVHMRQVIGSHALFGLVPIDDADVLREAVRLEVEKNND